ncbi:MAG TPA: NAD-dependent epimerase/dehydratase family protein [Thermoanaerobaculia bacterium]|nr:NAD-dependent epimerase/dehydratase family protein [Thermoanaerobaculia bacterium]
MKVLVTGGTGFLGRRIVAGLAPRHTLRLLVRPGSSRERFPKGVEFAAGDVTDRFGLQRAAAGCDAVVHAAALVKIVAPAREFDRINVEGLKNALAAAEHAGVSRFVYVSSFMALGPTEGGPGGQLDESAEPRDRPWINDYERTKTLADRAARQAIAEGAPVTIVYPGVIYGPGEMTEGNLVVRHVLDLVHRRLPALIGSPDRRWNYVHVEDVARGVALALEAGSRTGRYMLGGENVRLSDFYRTVEELTGVRVPRRRLPDGLAKAAGALQKGWARLRGSTPQLTPDLVEVYRHDWAYSSAKAEAELGYRFRPLAKGLAATIAWLEESGQWKRAS